jgi:hypothetical protein
MEGNYRIYKELSISIYNWCTVTVQYKSERVSIKNKIKGKDKSKVKALFYVYMSTDFELRQWLNLFDIWNERTTADILRDLLL